MESTGATGTTEQTGATGTTEQTGATGTTEQTGATGTTEQTGATGTTEQTGATGTTEQTGATGTTQDISSTDLSGIPIDSYTAPPPDILSIDDLIDESTRLLAKEQADGDALRMIGLQSALSLKPKLVEWVTRGKPNAYPIITVPIEVPQQCSDGVVRSLPEYITFCSGKSIGDHTMLLQAKLIGMVVSFVRMGQCVAIVVSQA